VPVFASRLPWAGCGVSFALRRVSKKLRVPKPRSKGLAGVLRALWTAPTTWVGRGFARLLGCPSPERVGGEVSSAYLYRLPGHRVPLGAVALGHAILVEPEFMADREAWLLAHELSHTRQHDWLGPTYLVVHGLLQLVSALCFLVRPIPGFTPQHAYNPLERNWICVPFDILVDARLPAGSVAVEVLTSFGVEDRAHPPSRGEHS